MSNLPPPPYREKDITSQPWQKWFASLQSLLSPIASGAGLSWASMNKSGSNIADLQFRSHTSLQDINTASAFHLSETNHTQLTGNQSNDLHYHNSDRNLANASGIARVTNGGTGADTPAGARANLVAAQSGANADITSLSGITGDILTPNSINLALAPTVVQSQGKLSWNAVEDTLNIGHLGGVVQQVGLETFYRAGNATGVAIPNGTVVGFGGSSGSVVTAQPYIANGTMLSLYAMGLATETIGIGATGKVTNFGYVHDIDTTGTPITETWLVGDILYAHPTLAGKLTKNKPTAPNIVVPMAAVITVNALTGVLLVRPTLSLQLYYGSFLCTTSPAIIAANTAYTIPFDTTASSYGVTVGTPTSRLVFANAGQYDVSISVQAAKTSAAQGYVWVWVRKNGVDIPNSAIRTTLQGSNAEAVITRNELVSAIPTDYIEICYAADNVATNLLSRVAPLFAPADPAVTVTISQVNQ